LFVVSLVIKLSRIAWQLGSISPNHISPNPILPNLFLIGGPTTTTCFVVSFRVISFRVVYLP